MKKLPFIVMFFCSINLFAQNNPTVHIVSGPDVIQLKPDTSAFGLKDLINADAKDIAKYINKSVVTADRVVSTRVIGANRTILLNAGADSPNQDFTIVIDGESSDKFDSPEFYFKGKQVKVTGKVIQYLGKPAIIISDPNQIQVIPVGKTKN